MVSEYQVRKDKDKKKHENWWINVCNLISKETKFPNDEIIEMYMCNNHGEFTGLSYILSCIYLLGLDFCQPPSC